jgi:hypothetical protein
MFINESIYDSEGFSDRRVEEVFDMVFVLSFKECCNEGPFVAVQRMLFKYGGLLFFTPLVASLDIGSDMIVPPKSLNKYLSLHCLYVLDVPACSNILLETTFQKEISFISVEMFSLRYY